MSPSPRLDRPERLVLCAETAADLMAPCAVSLPAASTLKEAASFLASSDLTAVPVIDESGRPVGVLSRSDIVEYHRGNLLGAGAGRPAPAAGPVRVTWTDCDVLEADSAPVKDLMTPVVISVPAAASASAVVAEMLTRKVHQLFVVAPDGALVGVVSTVDVLRHLRPEGQAPRHGRGASAARAFGREPG